MNDTRRFQLLYGPYRAPRCRIGRRLDCAIRSSVKVTGISDGLIPWPQTSRHRGERGGRRFLIACGGRARAIRREAAQAVAHWFGVTGQTVSAWRKALGVDANNTGTSKLRKAWGPEVLTDEVRETGKRMLRSPAYRAKVSAAKKGKAKPRALMDWLHAGNVGRHAE
jgi:hypothetical protein